MEKFRDFANDVRRLDGDKLQISQIFNKEIVVIAYRLTKSKISDAKQLLQLQFTYPNEEEKHIVLTNSTVIIKQLEQYKEHLPFTAKVMKVHSYYTFE